MSLAYLNPRSYVKFPHPPKQYIMFLHDECMDFGWDEKREIPLFHKLWSKGLSIYDIADEMRRDPDEILLLIVDQRRGGQIEDRPGGIFGKLVNE